MRCLCMLLQHSRTKPHQYSLHCLVWTEDFDPYIRILSEGGDDILTSGSHSIHESMKKGTQSFQGSSTQSPWLKHSTLHMGHCGHGLQKVVHHSSHILHHTRSFVSFVHHPDTLKDQGHWVSRDTLLHLLHGCSGYQQPFLHKQVVFEWCLDMWSFPT